MYISYNLQLQDQAFWHVYILAGQNGPQGEHVTTFTVYEFGVLNVFILHRN